MRGVRKEGRMIKDTYLREIVEKWGRREITTSMVVEAEKVKYGSDEYQNYLTQLYAAQQSQYPHGYLWMYGGGSLLGSLGSIGSFLVNTGRCPYCGR